MTVAAQGDRDRAPATLGERVRHCVGGKLIHDESRIDRAFEFQGHLDRLHPDLDIVAG